MEKIEILILGDCREAVICAKFAKKNYSDRHVGMSFLVIQLLQIC